ncbi:MAG: type II toxin-antitoxin system RelE/ParE family toxin [Bacteroidota bacterium]|nr:type II toxin-antitoxin system RelE/ParE family toxin [Bacteroidota bacterium]
MIYRVVIRKQALKELEELPLKTNKQISKSIDSLSINPRPAGCKKLKGDNEEMWRIRAGNYRVLYTIEDKIKVVEIRKIGDRKDIY